MTWLMEILQDFTRRTASDKAFNIDKIPKCDGF